MYCKIYIHSDSEGAVKLVLEEKFGAVQINRSTYYFCGFDISIRSNDEADRNKMRTYPDGFLYYELIAEAELYEDHIKQTDEILRVLWENNMPAVVSCGYEEELNRYIFSLR